MRASDRWENSESFAADLLLLCPGCVTGCDPLVNASLLRSIAFCQPELASSTLGVVASQSADQRWRLAR